MFAMIGIVVIIITYIIYISSAYDDSKQTQINKKIAKDRKAYCYTEKRGGKSVIKLTSNGKRVVVNDEEIKDYRTGKTIHNVKDEALHERQRYCIRVARRMGYSIYPVCFEDTSNECPLPKTPILKDPKTGETFIYYKTRSGWKRNYYQISGGQWKELKQDGKGVWSGVYNLDKDPNKDMFIILHDSRFATKNLF